MCGGTVSPSSNTNLESTNTVLLEGVGIPKSARVSPTVPTCWALTNTVGGAVDIRILSQEAESPTKATLGIPDKPLSKLDHSISKENRSVSINRINPDLSSLNRVLVICINLHEGFVSVNFTNVI